MILIKKIFTDLVLKIKIGLVKQKKIKIKIPIDLIFTTLNYFVITFMFVLGDCHIMLNYGILNINLHNILTSTPVVPSANLNIF